MVPIFPHCSSTTAAAVQKHECHMPRRASELLSLPFANTGQKCGRFRWVEIHLSWMWLQSRFSSCFTGSQPGQTSQPSPRSPSHKSRDSLAALCISYHTTASYGQTFHLHCPSRISAGARSGQAAVDASRCTGGKA